MEVHGWPVCCVFLRSERGADDCRSYTKKQKLAHGSAYCLTLQHLAGASMYGRLACPRVEKRIREGEQRAGWNAYRRSILGRRHIPHKFPRIEKEASDLSPPP